MSFDVDVVIVGGGIGGLVAACKTSRSGLRALLVEAAPAVGGRARTREDHGFCFNQGPHALFNAGAFSEALRGLDVSIAGGPPKLAKGSLLWPEGRQPMLSSAAGIAGLSPLNPLERLELAPVFLKIASANYDFAGQPLSRYSRSLRPRVASLLEAMVRLSCYAHAPDRLDCQWALDQLRLSFNGVAYLDGGWSRAVEALRVSACESGCEVQAECRAVEIENDDALWRTVIEGGRTITSRSVILAVDPAECLRLHPRSPQLASAVAATVPVRAVCLDLALSSRPIEGSGFALGVGEPIYFSVHSDSAEIAPQGGVLIHTARYLAPDENASPQHLADLESLVDQMQPGWRPLVVARQKLAGIVVANDMPDFTRRGRRTPSVVPDSPGLFLVGDWIGDIGMLSDAAAASARAAASSAILHCQNA